MKIAVVGAGIAGATAAALLCRAGHSVEVFETRQHIAGNCYDGYINNVLVHQYGGHIFHTDNQEVWDFISSFTRFNSYIHYMHANTKRGIVRLPLLRGDIKGMKSKEIVDLILRDYSEKQWGVPFESIPSVITSRIKLYRDFDDPRCFTDRWQGIPIPSWTNAISNMLHNIPVHLNVARDAWRHSGANIVIYSGKIDEFYNYVHGKLEYRSLIHVHQQEKPREYCVINECNKQPYTRSYDNSFWLGSKPRLTIVTYEYPTSHDVLNIPYYTVPTQQNIDLYSKYLGMCDKYVLFVGRLGRYKYMNVDDAILDTMQVIAPLL